jgi:hypothetical protein
MSDQLGISGRADFCVPIFPWRRRRGALLVTELYQFLSPWGMQLELVSYQLGMEVLNANPGALWSPKEG